MLMFALALAAPMPFTEIHQRDIACVVEIAVLADEQKRGVMGGGADAQASGKRWAGLVGARIVEETGQPREVVAFAMTEAAKARAGNNVAPDSVACRQQMNAEIALADAANAPLPKPLPKPVAKR